MPHHCGDLVFMQSRRETNSYGSSKKEETSQKTVEILIYTTTRFIQVKISIAASEK
jgi:hypothetical protein